MTKTKDLVACVVDHSLFLPIARRLAREYAHVYYTTPTEKAFPTVHDICGDGFPEIEFVKSLWQVKSKCDLFVFPDIGYSPEQWELLGQGFPVWGARSGDALESLRGKFLDTLEKTGLPVPKHRRILGMTALRDYLEVNKEKYIKISTFRGDWETFHFRSWEEDEDQIDAYAVRFGPWKEKIMFYVFDPIETMIEDGVDSYNIAGQWPSLVIHGMECKDKSYLGTFQKFSELPEEVRIVSEAFAPVLKQYDYRSLFSTEVRITKDGESYFIDPTCRAGSPPHQVMCEMVANLGEIFWQGANGVLVDPEPAFKFGVQSVLSVADREGWNTAKFPEELDRWVKCGSCVQIDGRTCYPPTGAFGNNDIGWLTGCGDTIIDAIEHLKTNAEKLPDGITCATHALTELLREVHEAESKGMEFTDQLVPEPAEALT